MSGIEQPRTRDDTYPEYSNLLRSTRQRYGLSATEVAKRINCSDSTYRNCETGRGTPGVFELLDRVFSEEDALAVRTSWEGHRSNQSKQRDLEAQMLGRRKRDRRKLDGDWHALWETTIEGAPNFNREVLHAEWVSGDALQIGNAARSPDNPRGGYVWSATLHLHDGSYLMGTYIPLDPEIQSRGTMFAVVHRSGRSMKGLWAGCNYDSELAGGHFVLSRSPDDTESLMQSLVGHPIDFSANSSFTET